MSRDLGAGLAEAFARETAFFQAYTLALGAAGDRGDRERLMAGQAAAARARGRLLAELERFSVQPSEGGVEIDPTVPALRQAEDRQRRLYEELEEAARAADDGRLERFARELGSEHERRRANLDELSG
jgi:hypothetical protein